MRAFSPAAAALESPQKNNTVHSTTKSWCSSPFSNLVALSPEGNSLSFQLDFSPGASFNSPHIKFPHDHIHSSPQSNTIHGHRDNFTSLFSPSIFSPFNKTLKTSKMDKSSSSSSAIYNEFLEAGDQNSKLISEDGEDTEDGLFKNTNMAAYHDIQSMNMNFGGYGPVGDHMQQGSQLHSSSAQSSSGDLLSLEGEGNESNGLAESTPRTQSKGKRNGQNSSSRNSKKAKVGTSSSGSGSIEKTSGNGKTSSVSGSASKSSTGKAHNLFASPSVLVRGSNQQPSNISPVGTEGGGGHCNCKKSKCLKLYCECFAALRYCNNCNCVECHNCPSHEKERQAAVAVTKERNAQAFQSKVNDKQGHTAGCNCKRSKCLKKYCECFEGSVFCGENCKCQSCQNFSGSAKLEEIKKNSNEKKDKVAAINSTVTLTLKEKELPSPHVLTVSNVTLAETGVRALNKSNSHALPQNTHGVIDQNILTTPLVNTPRKKRSRRCLSDSSDVSSGSSSDGQSRKASRGYTATGNFSPTAMSDVGNSPNSILSGSQNSASSGSGSGLELSPSDKHLDMMDASDSSPELSYLHSTEKRSGSCQPVQLLEPRYPFFGLDNHRATKLTALRCLEFLDNKDLYSMSIVNKLWCQAAMDDALWE
mmetsp:Transcript_10776/g.17689  ORF Transcript_10776/g.17689 Transcript_10776/m.17689 type:complete len:646 (-) Transcript_10776:239-2176(-)